MTELLDRLDNEHISDAGQWAAESLLAHGQARVRLAPGDATEYKIMIVAPGIEYAYGEPRVGKYYWVALCANFGSGYEWHGGAIDGGYAAMNWTNPSVSKATRAHSGEVVARFLTATAHAMAVLRGGDA